MNFRSFFILLMASVAQLWMPAIGSAEQPHLVIMLDITGSTSANPPLNDLEIERNAAKALLQQFASSAVKPKIAIGTFNVVGSEAARILPGGGLTDVYGSQSPASGLYAVIDSVQETGGYTDLGAAINVARAELENAPVTSPRYIILISDGTPNRPGINSYDECFECGCPNAYATATAAATTAEQLGIKIFGVHYAGNGFNTSEGIPFCNQPFPQVPLPEPQAGLNFMQQDIATNPSYFYQGNQNLTGIFGEVYCAISCDDGDPCTKDSCNSQIGQCQHTVENVDADSDGVVDCRDQCQGNDTLLGTACQVPNAGVCSRAGTNSCNSLNEIACTGGAVLDPSLCFKCRDLEGVPPSAEIDSAIVAQAKIAESLNSNLKRLGGKTRANRRFVAATKTSIQQAVSVTQGASATLPAPFKSCENLDLCAPVNQSPAIESFRRSAQSLDQTTKRLAAKLRKTGKALSKKTKKLIRQRVPALNASQTTIGAIPTFHSLCS